MTKPRMLAFMSYAHFDNDYENGRLTELRTRLSEEIRLQTGEEFSIFQDIKEIKWGQNWRSKIETSLDEALFLIPIITPSFFKSEPCRNESGMFLKRERKLNRNDLILPIYYIDSSLMNDEARRSSDRLAQAIASHQYADWRELRFEPFTSPVVGKRIAQMAIQIRDSLERMVLPQKRTRTRGTRTRARARAATSPAARRSNRQLSSGKNAGVIKKNRRPVRKPSAQTAPPIIIVDQMHRGNYTTIKEAIKAANSGDRILVRQGLYSEGLIIDKPVEIIGEGIADDVIIEASSQDALLFKTTMGRVSNLTLRQMGGGNWYAVDIAQGRLELEECKISNKNGIGLAIHNGADPRLRRNSLKDGIFIYGSGQGTLEDNDIFDCGEYAGVDICEESNPTLRHNRIYNNQCGVFFWKKGQGILEENDVFDNVNGIEISEDSNPILRRNRLRENKRCGVYIHDRGMGVFEDNDILKNSLAGVEISRSGSPIFRRNHINHNGDVAVWVNNAGAGVFEDNDLRDNVKPAWSISPNSETKVRRARNKEDSPEPATKK